ncbi:FecR family protein [Sphingobacterium sp. MYb382]|uniref:FecR family protein n=1 Tax=Sphingobacterium sp. MYb382 TaxID=2745278 RepID=UPI0030B5EF1D
MIKKLKQDIIKFWEGNASTDQRKDLLTKLNEHPYEIREAFGKEFEEDHQNGPSVRLADNKKKELLNSLLKKIQLNNENQLPKHQNRNYYWHTRIAATILLFLGLAIAVKYGQQDKEANQLQTHTLKNIIQENLGQEDLSILLPDGSTVNLAPQAKIAYTADYGLATRNLALLAGKAEFHVAKDKSKPFIVTANGYSVTALGTIFQVNTTAADHLKVRLLEGKIVVDALEKEAKFPSTILNPGEELNIRYLQNEASQQAATWQQKKFAANQAEALSRHIFGARNLVLHYDDTPLSTVVEQLENVYDQDFEFNAKELRNIRFTGKLAIHSTTWNTDSLTALFNTLTENTAVIYEVKNDKITIGIAKQ